MNQFFVLFLQIQKYKNELTTGNDTCVISRCVRYDIIFIRDQVWSRIKTSNPRENPQNFLGVIKIKNKMS